MSKARRWMLVGPPQGGPVEVRPATPDVHFKLGEKVEVAEVSALREEWEAGLRQPLSALMLFELFSAVLEREADDPGEAIDFDHEEAEALITRWLEALAAAKDKSDG